jgi:hypothetical protein
MMRALLMLVLALLDPAAGNHLDPDGATGDAGGHFDPNG